MICYGLQAKQKNKGVCSEAVPLLDGLLSAPPPVGSHCSDSSFNTIASITVDNHEELSLVRIFDEIEKLIEDGKLPCSTTDDDMGDIFMPNPVFPSDLDVSRPLPQDQDNFCIEPDHLPSADFSNPPVNMPFSTSLMFCQDPRQAMLPCSFTMKKRMRDEALTLTQGLYYHPANIEDESSNSDDILENDPAQSDASKADQWAIRFEELLQFRGRTGHCLVPHTCSENPSLARWVKRQRYQYKLLQDGHQSAMTHGRIQALERVGFVWDSQNCSWYNNLEELKQFRQEYNHCNVPISFKENPRLATWVKCQRRQYKLFQVGKPSNITQLRIQELNTLGFEWELRKQKKSRIA